MLAVVNQPRMQNTEAASFKIEGAVPKFVVVFLESAFGDALKVERSDDKDDSDSIPVDEWDWYKDIKAKMTPGDSIKANRGLRGMTQKALAEKLGVPVQNVSEMERGKRAVSRKMALKLGDVFGTDPASFFDFGK